MSSGKLWSDEPEVMEFLEQVLERQPNPAKVLELGSYAMHDHDPRPLFPGSTYVGVDWRAGPGVDVVERTSNRAALLRQIGARSWDLVLSISALEHDPEWYDTLWTAVNAAKVDGLIAVTCAGPGWEPHELDCAPPHKEGLCYQNRSLSEIVGQISSAAHFTRPIAYVEELRAYYSRRTVYPHWRRANVIAQLSADPDLGLHHARFVGDRPR